MGRRWSAPNPNAIRRRGHHRTVIRVGSLDDNDQVRVVTGLAYYLAIIPCVV